MMHNTYVLLVKTINNNDIYDLINLFCYSIKKIRGYTIAELSYPKNVTHSLITHTNGRFSIYTQMKNSQN